jgi:hypothetical protein
MFVKKSTPYHRQDDVFWIICDIEGHDLRQEVSKYSFSWLGKYIIMFAAWDLNTVFIFEYFHRRVYK